MRDVPDKTYFPDLVWRVNVRDDLCDADYLEQVLSSPWGRKLVTSSATGTSQSMRKINKAGFSALAIPLPGLVEQKEYAERCRAAGDLVWRLRGEAEALAQFRSVLLTSFLTHEIAVPESYDALLAGVA